MRVLFLIIFQFIVAFSSFAQQNFFNVPSSDLTQKHKLFFQQQFNFSQPVYQSNTTITFGLGHNLEVGVNVLGISFDPNNHLKQISSPNSLPYFPFGMINLQKKFPINNQWALALGSQIGVTLSKNIHPGNYYYFNSIYSSKNLGLKCVGGLYRASHSFFGPGTRNFETDLSFANQFGLQLGIEKSIWKDRLYFQGDYISGKHTLGETVLGGCFYLTNHWILSGGYQIPNRNSSSVKAFVFEITYIPEKD
jgi:hypothetical protein